MLSLINTKINLLLQCTEFHFVLLNNLFTTILIDFTKSDCTRHDGDSLDFMI